MKDLSKRELTLRERQVVDQLLKGKSNKEIGDELGIESVTVKVHLHDIQQRLGLTGRVRIVVWAYESGYVARIRATLCK